MGGVSMVAMEKEKAAEREEVIPETVISDCMGL